LRSRIVGGGGYVSLFGGRDGTEDIRFGVPVVLLLSSRDLLSAASFALFASISARRRSAREVAEDMFVWTLRQRRTARRGERLETGSDC
jgi:hypothetical protein